ncbi:mitochondrial 37S ribosomal protein mS35 [Aspergillus stella-maris]|uniref:mitochondrial 37S ribosomal protein mS35 n=1 Tax=Aspergillus stella-maris TaxID=1810926 RepID=UPI003CCD167B
MVLIARCLGRSTRVMARRGPIALPYRQFSASAPTLLPEDPPDPVQPKDPRPEDYPPAPEYSPDLLSREERMMYDMMSPEERVEFDAEQRRAVAEFNNPQVRSTMFAELDDIVNGIDKEAPLKFTEERKKVSGFWANDEDDEFGVVPDNDDVHDDEITSAAHAELELHREIREYARIAAWDMPHLSKLAQPFTLPPETHILRFRYTTYMGESHPAESKVVVELASKDLAPKYLTEAQRQTFLKLVGPRYNPDTDIIRMSSEKFDTRAQNKRYLGDIIQTLLKEAKEGDSFADIPLDLRHHKPKVRHQFPDSWAMTEERKKQLEANRAERKRLSAQRQGSVVDGNVIVAAAIESLPALNPALQVHATQERQKVAAQVGARMSRPVQKLLTPKNR